jgi:hypothetical protein
MSLFFPALYFVRLCVCVELSSALLQLSRIQHAGAEDIKSEENAS